MAKKRKAKASTSSSLFDPSVLKDFFNSPSGRQLLADVVMAAAAAAAAALLASNKGKKAMGKAAMQSVQTAVLGVVANAMAGRASSRDISARRLKAR
jgi:hypothetical protein